MSSIGPGDWIFVDDRDPGIAYAGSPGSGTIWHGGVPPEYDQTTTGLEAGDSLTYYFNASMIGVFGTYGPTGPTGPPIALYQVDSSAATTVTGPITQATLYRQTFWTSNQLSSLSPGAFHKLAVTATVPNATLWVDYLAYPPPTSTSTSTTSISSTTSTSVSSTSTTGAGHSATFVTVPTATSTGTQTISGPSNPKINTPAIITGVVIGTVALILAAAFGYARGRRSRPASAGLLDQGPVDVMPNMAQSHIVAPNSPPSGDARLSVVQQGGSQEAPARPLPQVPVKTFVGPMEGSMDIPPPEYQEHD